MSKLNVLSTENVSTYHKFKLMDGNLYMNNRRMGYEEFGAGKNIELVDNKFGLTDDVDLSGSLVVDGSMNLGGNLYIDASFVEVRIDPLGTFRIYSVSYENIDAIEVYDWAVDPSQNIYYDKGNVRVGHPTAVTLSGEVIDASLIVIGNVYVQNDLVVEGNILTDSFDQTSDARLKTNVRPLANGLESVRKVTPYIYEKRNRVEAGVLAQDILAIDELAFLVGTHPHTGIYQMNYTGLQMYTILGLQELDRKLDVCFDRLDKRLTALEKKMDRLS